MVEQLLNTEAKLLMSAENMAATRIPTRPGGRSFETKIKYAVLGFLKK